MKSNYLRSFVIVEMLLLTLMISTVQGEPPTPPSVDVSWNPPNTGATGGQSQYIMAGYSSTYTLTVWTSGQMYHSGNAQAGSSQNSFSLNEPVYLYVDTPIGWSDNFMWLYEHHQTNQSIGRWRFWRREIGYGRFMFGPFYPDQSQPSGNYTWKIWTVNVASGEYQTQVVSFTWGEEIPEFPTSAVGTILVLLLAFPILVRSFSRRRAPDGRRRHDESNC